MTAKVMVIAAAVAAALLPTSPSWIEQTYSTSFYIGLQQKLTSATNAVPISLLDITACTLVVAVLLHIVRSVRHRPDAYLRALAGSLLDVATLAAAVYLIFLVSWGMNYRRAPITARFDHDRSRVSAGAVEELARGAAGHLNALQSIAHGRPWRDLADLPSSMAAAFDLAQRDAGLERVAVPGRPKRTLLEWYFRRAAIDGMTDPFFLEVLVNRDILPFERPSVVAHEWAHLAGFADEAEAGFLGWLTTMRGDEQARYSGWLTVFGYAAGSLDAVPRDRLVDSLEPAVREDLRAIARRLHAAAPGVRAFARAAYDRFLRANRVESGVRSYDELVTLIAGTRFHADGRPVRSP